jgi:thiosulfate dehydrogenase [quinone] large subunit
VAQGKADSATERFLIVLFRLIIGWTFLWGAIHHFGDSKFVVEFLSQTKTFHFLYGPMIAPAIATPLTFLVEYGQLLIGLSLISGLLVRASAPFAILMMLLFWTAHMNFPYLESPNKFLVDFHVTYAGLLVYLMMKNAGHVIDLDAWAERLPLVRQSPALHAVVG